MKYHEDYELEMTEDEQKYHELLKKVDVLLDKVADCTAFVKTTHTPLNQDLDSFLRTFKADVNVDIDFTFTLSINGLVFNHKASRAAKVNILLLEEWFFTNFNSLNFNDFNESQIGMELFSKVLEIFNSYSDIMNEQFYCK